MARRLPVRPAKPRRAATKGSGHPLQPKDRLFLVWCGLHQVPEPVAEHTFAAAEGRRYRFDWAWPEHMVALEVEGGVWIQGRHNRASGFLKDLAKYNLAAVLGWRVLRVTPQQLMTAYTLTMLRGLL